VESLLLTRQQPLNILLLLEAVEAAAYLQEPTKAVVVLADI
jgi:hypothetical protein